MKTFRKRVCVLLVIMMALGVAPLGEFAPFLNTAPFAAVAYATAGDATAAHAPAPAPSAEPESGAVLEGEQKETQNISIFTTEIDGILHHITIADDLGEDTLVEGGELTLEAKLWDGDGEAADTEIVSPAGFSFQWFFFGPDSDNNLGWQPLGGATGKTLVVPANLVRNTQVFSCDVQQDGQEDVHSVTYEIEADGRGLITGHEPEALSLNLYMGEEASFSVTTADRQNIAIEWSKLSGDIEFPTGTETDKPEIIFVASVSGSMTIQCQVTEDLGNGAIWTETVAMTLNVHALPTITITADTEKWWPGKAAPVLTATVGEGGIPGETRYTWQKLDADAAPYAWENLTEKGRVHTVSIDPAPKDNDQYRYALLDDEGEVLANSEPAVITVVPKLTISLTKKPGVNEYFQIGDTVTFVAEYGPGTSSANLVKSEVYWQYSTDGGSTWIKDETSASIDGNTITLNKTVTSAMNGRRYRCHIKDSDGQTADSEPSYDLKVSFLTTTRPALTITGEVGKEISSVVLNDYFIGNPNANAFKVEQWYNTPTGIKLNIYDNEAGDKSYEIYGAPGEAMNAQEANAVLVVATNQNGSTATLPVYFDIEAQESRRYTVTILNQSGGRAFTNLNQALPGDEVTLTAIPYSGYYFDHWEINGLLVSNTRSSTTKFNMPRRNVYVTPYYRSGGYSDSSMSYGLYGGVSGSWTLSPLGLYALTSGFAPTSGYSGTNYPTASGLTTYNVPSAYPGVTFPSGYTGAANAGTTYPGVTYPGTTYPGTSTVDTSDTQGSSGAASTDPLAGVGVTQRSVTIYDSASTSGNSLGTLDKGKGVVVLGYEGSFAKVRFDSQTGYIPTDYVKTAFNRPFIASTNARIPVFTEMLENTSSRYSMLESGARVSVIGICGKWLIIAGAGGQVLYALSSGFNT